MPEALFNKILAQRAQLLTIKSHINNFYNDMYNLGTQLQGEGCPNSAQSVWNACIHLLDWRDQVSDGVDNYRWCETDTLVWINDNWPSNGAEYELTMAKILETIWASDPLEIFFFVNYIDAMRASIWNKEISAEKLHELYRHFSG